MKKLYNLSFLTALTAVTLLFVLPTTLSAQVSSYSAVGVTGEGAVYCLPKLAIDVTVNARKVTYTPGELCKYADRYLRLTGISDEPEEHWEITSVGMSYAPVPDAAKCYHIHFDTKSLAPLVQLSADGTLLAINTENPHTLPAAATPEVPAAAPLPDAHSFMTEEMLLSSSKAKLAELVAKEIYSIRDSRNSILRGQSDGIPADGEGLQLVLNNMQVQEDAYLRLFTGTTTEQTAAKTFRVIPDGNMQKQVVARFSRKLGIVDTDNLAGSAICMDVKSVNPLPAPKEAAAETVSKPSLTSKGNAADKFEGVVYNLPAKAIITVYSGGNTWLEDKVNMPQFGTTETLSLKLFNKKSGTSVILDPLTGALLKVENTL